MNGVVVELIGTSPLLHNRCATRGEAPGWRPRTDREQAEDRLHRDAATGEVVLPWWMPVVAIGRAAWSRDRVTTMPRDLVSAVDATTIEARSIAFRGEWRPQAFRPEGASVVALPRFDEWSAAVRLMYDPRYHAEEGLLSLLEHSGRHLGLPLFAPFAGKGPWGRFRVETRKATVNAAYEEATA
jgi:hypothetical protein